MPGEVALGASSLSPKPQHAASTASQLAVVVAAAVVAAANTNSSGRADAAFAAAAAAVAAGDVVIVATIAVSNNVKLQNSWMWVCERTVCRRRCECSSALWDELKAWTRQNALAWLVLGVEFNSPPK